MKSKIESKSRINVIQVEDIPHLLEEGEVGAVLELTLRDSQGGIVKHIEKKAESFVRQFLDLLWVQMNSIWENNTYYSVKDTGNTSRTPCCSLNTFATNAAIGDTTMGIIAGTGTTAPTISDYKLETPIAHGTGAGQLSYGAVTYGAPASDETTSQFTITRNLANSSGGTITVNEIGLYVKGYKPTSTWYFMTLRDVIAGGIAIPNGQTLTVNYRLQAVI